jgi:DNA polymerase III delta prime subunit
MAATSETIVAVQGATARPFRNAAEYVLAELERLALLVHAEVLRMRAARVLNEDNFRGLYLSEEQIDAILSSPASDGSADRSLAQMRVLSARATLLEQEIAARCAAGTALPLERLVRLYSLSRLERDALLLSIAPELDERFETLYSYAQNDVTRKRPTVGLILRLLLPGSAARLKARLLFARDNPLLRVPLVRFSDDAREQDASFLSCSVKPEERIIDFLLGESQMDSRLRSFTVMSDGARTLRSLHLPQPLRQELEQAASTLRTTGGALFFHGPRGAGQCEAAQALSVTAGRKLVVADLSRAQAAGALHAQVLSLLRREAQLRGANLLLTHHDEGHGTEQQQSHAPLFDHCTFGEMVSESRLIVFVAGEQPSPASTNVLSCPWAAFEFPTPSFQSRVQLWQQAIAAAGAAAQAGMAESLANQFVLTGGQIEDACRMAANQALQHGEPALAVTRVALEAAARRQSNQRLKQRAQKVTTEYEWSDLVLPQRTLQQLRDVCTAEKFRDVVYSEWGFDRRMMHGKGLSVLFSGPSGTGKTMSASILAHELGLDLYKIDLSTVISKYIGETEKQLSQIFHEAQTSNAILFFDEADAIFGKRSEVNDAHDRYANVEVAYLLQKMEEYEGIVILATNFRKNIDEAFTRRIQYIVEFPFPEAQYRERIWRCLIPSTAPMADDVDFSFLGRQFEMAGGNIRNAVLLAAFLAAEEGCKIRMEHFIVATSRELQKMGKFPSRSDFREYYDLTREPG